MRYRGFSDVMISDFSTKNGICSKNHIKSQNRHTAVNAIRLPIPWTIKRLSSIIDYRSAFSKILNWILAISRDYFTPMIHAFLKLDFLSQTRTHMIKWMSPSCSTPQITHKTCVTGCEYQFWFSGICAYPVDLTLTLTYAWLTPTWSWHSCRPYVMDCAPFWRSLWREAPIAKSWSPCYWKSDFRCLTWPWPDLWPQSST